ncbi:MAG: diguanylate cyclase domain-containing protein [Rubrivivax sp.]
MPTPSPDALAHASLDGLTGAGARAAFEPHWQHTVDRACRGGRCALVVFDVDHFKSINDAFGHRRGDAVLQTVVQRVRSATRDSDALFRYGGDEFVLVLPDTGKAEARELAQRILDAVRQPMADGGLQVSLSLGVAALPDDGQAATALFEAADRRSYAAKRQGRGRVVVADHPSSGPTLDFQANGRCLERDDALAQGQAFLQGLPTAGQGLLTITGAPGSGRSTMLAELARRASSLGWQVWSLQGSARLKARPFAALARACPDWPTNTEQSDDAAALRRAWQARAQAGGQTGTLVCVDDLADLDWSTLHLLRQLLGPTEDDVRHPVALAVVAGDAAGPGAVLGEAPLQCTLHLPAFQPDTLRVWLRLLLQWDPPAELLAWLAEHSGGLPGRARLLLQRLVDRQTLVHDGASWRLATPCDGAERDLAAAPRPPLHLPASLTSFIGREAELRTVCQALQQQRLVTLTGSGGTGKTRLALRAAQELLPAFRQGVWFVDLAQETEATAVPAAVAGALGVRKVRGRPLQTSLNQWLAGKELLLVLDNCEHLLDACAGLCDTLLRHSPDLRVLATSRAPLAVEGEHVCRVGSLQLPPAGDAPTTRALLQSEAVQLFLDRAHQASPGFKLSDHTAATVLQICRKLDGIPLAIELAAARLRALTVHQIAQRLDDRFNLLSSGRRGALPRQQTLRAMVDWSHGLLAPAEQVLLRRLAVFAGGCTLEAAEAICGNLAPLQPAQVLPLLASLTDQSLLQTQAMGSSDGPAMRYQMLETIRHHALEKLQSAGEAQALRDAHLQYMLTLAERSEPGVSAHQQAHWLAVLEAESANLQQAMTHAQAQQPATQLRLASALWRYWDLRGHRAAGLETLLQAVAQAPEDPVHALALARAGYIARNLGDFAQAEQLAARALDIARRQPAPDAEAAALFVLGASALELNRCQQACHHLHNALALFQADGNDSWAGTTLVFLGFEAEMRNDVASARHWMLQGLAATRRGGDRRRICHALVRLGFVAIAAGDAAQAVQHFEEALALGRDIGDKAYIANGHFLLGRAALFFGDFQRARQLLRVVTDSRDDPVASDLSWALLELAKVCWAEDDLPGFEAALTQVVQVTQQGGLDEARATALLLQGHAARARGQADQAISLAEQALAIYQRSRREGLCLCAELWGLLALDTGDTAQAARWLGAREALRERLFALDHYPFMLQRRAAVVAQLLQRLGAQAFSEAWQAGREWPEHTLLAQVPRRNAAGNTARATPA